MNDATKSRVEAPFDELIIREYLLDNPEFFCRYPELVLAMRLPHPERGTVSLVEKRQEQLRSRVQQLEEEITALMGAAYRNEQIYMFNTELSFKLLECKTLAELRDVLSTDLKKQFNFSHVRLITAHDIDNELSSIWQQRFVQEHYFGRLTQKESQRLFGSEVGSVALTKLSNLDNKVIFAIASPDAAHFHPEMDHLLLDQLRRLLEHLLPQL
ncbi:DUF484 family protein [Shewanella gelidii]|uniref:DUF484 domain-containing protein n=1 Tax=Shewanella gelidii TaxID=1642821 RepID=A0A917NC87_9GAMM|nr:DUF484 family protein [Shewanella gelidii]MCL1098708.1 DUF484 family protein [Shewanella gelidii]GGI88190.1 DUF484 domain-containing protein [Shewanella gelidii]